MRDEREWNSDGQSPTDARRKTSRMHHPANIGACGSEGHANSDLVGATANHVGHKAIDSDSGEKDGEHRRRTRRVERRGAARRWSARSASRASDIHDGQSAVDAVDGLLNSRYGVIEVAGITRLRSHHNQWDAGRTGRSRCRRCPPAGCGTLTSFAMPTTSTRLRGLSDPM